jgi:uncharacterized membrane protein
MEEPDLKDIFADGATRPRSHPLVAFLHLVLPFAILASTAFLLHEAGRLALFAKWAGVAFLTVGKLVILSGALPGNPLSKIELAAMEIYMDTLVGYFLAYNIHWLYRLPRAGAWFRRVQDYCRFWLAKQAWMRRWAFTGVMLFVMFPLTGTGAPAGSVLARLGGLGPKTTLVAIFLGSLLGCSLLTAFEVQHHWWFRWAGILLLAILLLLLYLLGRRLTRAAEEYARQRTGEA